MPLKMQKLFQSLELRQWLFLQKSLRNIFLKRTKFLWQFSVS